MYNILNKVYKDNVIYPYMFLLAIIQNVNIASRSYFGVGKVTKKYFVATRCDFFYKIKLFQKQKKKLFPC